MSESSVLQFQGDDKNECYDVAVSTCRLVQHAPSQSAVIIMTSQKSYKTGLEKMAFMSTCYCLETVFM